MVIGKFGNITYFKDINGNIGSITEDSSGSAELKVIDSKQKIVLKRGYKNRKGALKAWNNWTRTNLN